MTSVPCMSCGESRDKEAPKRCLHQANHYPTQRKRHGSNDANGWRSGPAEDEYMGRYDSPDNQRDSMG